MVYCLSWQFSINNCAPYLYNNCRPLNTPPYSILLTALLTDKREKPSLDKLITNFHPVLSSAAPSHGALNVRSIIWFQEWCLLSYWIVSLDNLTMICVEMEEVDHIWITGTYCLAYCTSDREWSISISFQSKSWLYGSQFKCFQIFLVTKIGKLPLNWPS